MRASLDEDLLVRVAWLHYQEGYSQNDIADMLHLSRPKVSRLLDRAREKGIVRFFIKQHARLIEYLASNFLTAYAFLL
ncbi:MAG: MarR family transcriptional regulator [Candidatus Caldatribacteriaceae bacterium]